eukprot:CAMPEP_0194400130 /NCGR_PEP_ID=MMETSP0174-20130528/127038_1 /TAXON_ID=216777 /ORGANISM="Proboscia alata, Strain PI-D3" /LENGTH=171 /DNA_ID=CAMNT_0039196603 /DNA_START=160 /DNA_END=672 /DNA_ORIENTATION=-
MTETGTSLDRFVTHGMKIAPLANVAKPTGVRQPAFLIIGAQKAGTTALAHYLVKHPHIIKADKKNNIHNKEGKPRMGSKELRFYVTSDYDKSVKQWLSARNISITRKNLDIESPESKNATAEIRNAREDYLNDFDLEALNANSRFISFDATPLYLFFSNKIPQRAKAITPW